MLPLDDCLYALQPTIPALTRSSLHRCLQRHGISRLVGGEKPVKTKFKSYPIGFFHIDIAEVQTAQGKLYMFVAIDRTSKFAFVEVHREAKRHTAGDFLHLVETVPYRITKVLTDNGTHFTTPGAGGWAAPLILQLFRDHLVGEDDPLAMQRTAKSHRRIHVQTQRGFDRPRVSHVVLSPTGRSALFDEEFYADWWDHRISAGASKRLYIEWCAR